MIDDIAQELRFVVERCPVPKAHRNLKGLCEYLLDRLYVLADHSHPAASNGLDGYRQVHRLLLLCAGRSIVDVRATSAKRSKRSWTGGDGRV